jgi:PAS domain S-box-containing protein
MAESPRPLPPIVDVGVLGQTMLAAAETAHIGVTVTLVEPASARNIYISEVAAEILGWPVGELLAGDPMNYIAEEDLPHLRKRLALRASGGVGHARYEITAIRKDGRRVPVEVTASDVVIDSQRAVFAFLVDVTGRKVAEQARLHTEARFRELIERGPEPIMIHRDGRLVYVNAALVNGLRYPSAEELCRVPMNQIVVQEDVAAMEARLKILANDGARLPPHVYRARRFDGSVAVIEASSVPFDYEGKPSILTMLRDVTDRRLLEARLLQADRLAALGTMAAGIAHEINNPLAYVVLNLDWIARKLSETPADPSSMAGLTEMLLEARRGAERVATIVRELRSFSRVDGETRAPVDLAAVVESAIRIAGHEIRHRARIATSFAPARPVLANEGRVEQVVLNLLLNAAQAMVESRVGVNEIRLCVREDGDGRTVLEVSDNGQGIPAEVLPRIFDPFFTTKPAGVGTGLGLSICHGIVASLGGQITVHSELGEGTTFRVVFPTADPGNAPPSGPITERSFEPDGARARVLVVDDETQIGQTMRELLAAAHDVVAMTTGSEALAALRSGQEFDVIFCDLMMPGMSGIELFELIREERPGVEKRVVFMTGGAFTHRAAEFLASVENRRVEKPFSLGLIERIVREMKATRG